jgi:hypothetical protein
MDDGHAVGRVVDRGIRIESGRYRVRRAVVRHYELVLVVNMTYRLLAIVFLLALPLSASAATIKQQTTSSAAQSGNNCFVGAGGPCYQKLGTGLTGYARTYDIIGFNSSGNDWNTLEECTDATYSSCSVVATTNTADAGSNVAFTFTFGTAYCLVSSKYYRVHLDLANIGYAYKGNSSGSGWSAGGGLGDQYYVLGGDAACPGASTGRGYSWSSWW